MSSAEYGRTNAAETYLPFVRKIACRIARRLPRSVELDDLVSAGTVGLMEAIDRFEPEENRRFETYAEFRIKGAILDELRRRDPLNRGTRSTQNLVSSTFSRLSTDLGRPPEPEEVAAALQTSVEHFLGRLSEVSALRVVPLEPEAVVVKESVPSQEDQLAFKELVARARRGMEKLTERQQQVLNLYYVEELTQAQIGEVLGVTESRVCQILGESVKRLRALMASAEEE
jgi:RNA polymerase sigma factor FliA